VSTPEFPTARPRRLRRTPALRRLVEQTHVQPSDLLLPMFVKEGISEPQPVVSMPGVVQHTRDSLRKPRPRPWRPGWAAWSCSGCPR